MDTKPRQWLPDYAEFCVTIYVNAGQRYREHLVKKFNNQNKQKGE